MAVEYTLLFKYNTILKGDFRFKFLLSMRFLLFTVPLFDHIGSKYVIQILIKIALEIEMNKLLFTMS